MKTKTWIVFAIVAMAFTGMNVKAVMTANHSHSVAIASFSAMGEVGGEIGGESGGEIGGESGGIIDDIVGHCVSGGPGSSSCSLAGGIDIVGSGGSIDCSTTCRDGYYACCGLSGCKCIKEE